MVASLPIAEQIACEVERAGGEDDVAGRGEFEGALQGSGGFGDDFEGMREVARDQSERLGGDGTRLGRLRHDDVDRERKKQTGDFVDGFIAHGAVNEVNAAVGELFFPECREFARASRIVGAVEIDGGAILEAFDAAGPADCGEAAERWRRR